MARKPEIHVHYDTDGEGRWWRREWKPQCTVKIFFRHQCQGVAGHKGVHWRFGDDGCFEWKHNDAEPMVDNAAAGMTPPGHSSYRSRTPQKMAARHYRAHFTDIEVRDAAVIARLEKDDPPEADATVSRPCTAAEIKWLAKSHPGVRRQVASSARGVSRGSTSRSKRSARQPRSRSSKKRR